MVEPSTTERCFMESRLDLPPLMPQFSNHSFIYDEKGSPPPEPAPPFPYEKHHLLKRKTKFGTRSTSSESLTDSEVVVGVAETREGQSVGFARGVGGGSVVGPSTKGNNPTGRVEGSSYTNREVPLSSILTTLPSTMLHVDSKRESCV